MKPSLLRRFLGPKRPPGPSLSQLQNLPLYRDDFCGLEYPVQLTKKYGDIFYISAVNQYVITGPEGFQHVLKTNAKNYQKCNFFYNRMKSLFGNSILVSDGVYWKQRRKITTPAFQSLAIQSAAPIISKNTEQLANRWRFEPPGAVNMLSEMYQLILGTTFQLLTGQICPDPKIKELEKIIHFANWYVSHSTIFSPWKPTYNNLKFHYYMKKMNDYFLSVIQERRKQMNPHAASEIKPPDNTSQTGNTGNGNGNARKRPLPQKIKGDFNIHHFTHRVHLLDLLMHATDEKDLPLTDAEILDEFKTFLLTGHETTACTLTWMWCLLSENPDWRLRLEEELDQTLEGHPPTIDDLSRLPVLKAIFHETMRLYPVWALARTNIEEDVIYGYQIPKGSLIALNVYALHRHPKYWDKPETFNPKRFLLQEHCSSHPYGYLPFSTGPRTCIGSHLATVETLLVAAALAQFFRFDKVRKTKIRVEPCISLRPRNGLWMNIMQREKSEKQ